MKYKEYRAKYREICLQFSVDDNFQSLRDELKQKDDELIRVIGRCSELKGALRSKEEELEVSRGSWLSVPIFRPKWHPCRLNLSKARPRLMTS